MEKDHVMGPLNRLDKYNSMVSPWDSEGAGPFHGDYLRKVIVAEEVSDD